jgi:hypothetical protein
LDHMIYPRLRLKSEVVASVVDGHSVDAFELTNSVNLPVQRVIDQIRFP